MDILKDLAAITGAEFVTGDEAVLSEYAADLSFTKASKPEAVVYPKTAEEVSRIVKWANENNMPLIPVSSPIHLYGTTVPKQGGVIVNMKRFDEIYAVSYTHLAEHLPQDDRLEEGFSAEVRQER